MSSHSTLYVASFLNEKKNGGYVFLQGISVDDFLHRLILHMRHKWDLELTDRDLQEIRNLRPNSYTLFDYGHGSVVIAKNLPG